MQVFFKNRNKNINNKIKRSKELLILLFGSLSMNVNTDVAECSGRAGSKVVKEIGKALSSNTPPATSVSITKNVNIQNHEREMALVRGGRIVVPEDIPKVLPSNNDDTPLPLQSDISGKHPVNIAEACKSPNCAPINCGATPEKCEKNTYGGTTVVELIGNNTHNIPKDKNGVFLGVTDFKGKEGQQFMITEKTTVPVDPSNFKEDQKVTEYIQVDDRYKTLIKALPDDSVLKLESTFNNDTPMNEDL
jgi:hypothetical protein